MSGPCASSQTLGSSCGTLDDGVAFVETELLAQKFELLEDDEAELQRQLEDPIVCYTIASISDS